MASDALSRFKNSLATANRLLGANDGHNAILGRVDFFHASWAAYIASWDAYLKAVCLEYITKSNVALTLGIPNPAVIAFQGIHEVALSLFRSRIEKFNTPNFDNSREFVVQCTGQDFYGDWRWDGKGYTNIQIKELLNEAVRVRHSFAHGFPVRNIAYLSVVDGNNAISYRKAVFVRSMVNHLAITTDGALNARLLEIFGRAF